MLYALAMLAAAPAVPALPADQVAAARSLLDSGLIDYPGSRFRGFHVVRTGPVVALCGEVNPRNRSGGLSGWLPLGIVLAGEAEARLYPIEGDGYTGATALAKRCPIGNPVVAPPGAVIEPDDVTALIAPAQAPSAS